MLAQPNNFVKSLQGIKSLNVVINILDLNDLKDNTSFQTISFILKNDIEFKLRQAGLRVYDQEQDIDSLNSATLCCDIKIREVMLKDASTGHEESYGCYYTLIVTIARFVRIMCAYNKSFSVSYGAALKVITWQSPYYFGSDSDRYRMNESIRVESKDQVDCFLNSFLAANNL